MKGRITNSMHQQRKSNPSPIKMVFSHTVIQHHARRFYQNEETILHNPPLNIVILTFLQLIRRNESTLKMSKLWCLMLMNKHICRLQLQLQFKPCFVIRFALCVVFACCFRMWPTYALYLLLKPDQTLHRKCLFLLLSRVR